MAEYTTTAANGARQSESVRAPAVNSAVPRELPGDMTPLRLSQWTRPDSACLGIDDAENARRIRALAYEVLVLRAQLKVRGPLLSDHERGKAAIVAIEEIRLRHGAGCPCPPCFYATAAVIAEGRRLIWRDASPWFWRRGVSP